MSVEALDSTQVFWILPLFPPFKATPFTKKDLRGSRPGPILIASADAGVPAVSPQASEWATDA